MTIRRAFASIISDRLAETRDFYVELFGFRVDFDSDWFVHLQAPDNNAIELGILRRDHDLVPEAFRKMPAGAMVTVVVPDADAVRERCRAMNIDVLQEPKKRILRATPDVDHRPERNAGRRVERVSALAGVPGIASVAKQSCSEGMRRAGAGLMLGGFFDKGGETVSTGTLKRRLRARRPEDGAKTFGNVKCER